MIRLPDRDDWLPIALGLLLLASILLSLREVKNLPPDWQVLG